MNLRKLAAIGLAGALITAACGDDSDNEAETEDAAAGDVPEHCALLEEAGAQTSESEAAAEEEETEAAEGEDEEVTVDDREGELRVWFNALDTPEEMREFAIAEFNERFPNVEVTIEQQEWEGLDERLTNVLPTDDAPDIVELGNTQAQTYEAAGALLDLSDHYEDFGGDDLLDSLVASGTYEDSFYGVPMYAGVRNVIYRTDLFEELDLEIPTTMEEFIETGRTLQEEYADDNPNFSGIYFPGRNWHAMLAFIWDAGGDIAVQNDDGEWVGTLDCPQSMDGLETVADIMTNVNSTPADSTDETAHEDFCAEEVGMMPAPGWMFGTIMGEDAGCPDTMEGRVAAFALPGSEGDLAPAFLGGSNLGIPATSEDNAELAVEFLEVITGEEFQRMYFENGLIPARKSLLGDAEGDAGLLAQAEAAENTRFVPASEFWAEVEGQEILHDMGSAIARGDDVAAEAERANQAIEDILNQ